ncbi:MAG: hypothetical protein OCD01_05640 [Fibrobacterales bacterium]
MALFNSLGFSQHPFSKTNADEEPDLKEYFVPPPYFDAVIGDSNNPSPSIILAPRGAGKSALRKMVEAESNKNQFLSVTYDRFEFTTGTDIDDITLQYHLRNIITRVLLSYLSYLSEYPDVQKSLSKDDKKYLGVFASTYLGDLNGERLQELLNDLKSLPEKFKTFWKQNVGVMESVVNFVLKNYDLEKIDLPNMQNEEKRLSETYKHQLTTLLELVRKIGFKSIYILIDRVDETELTGNDPEATYKLIQPIIRDLDLLGLPGFGFKFFLWDKILPFFKEDARPDRVSEYKLNWTRDNLKKVLNERLKVYSSKDIQNFQQMCSDQTKLNLDDAICIMANGSPRNLIRFCEQIFAVQGERNPESKKIDFASIDIGITNFSEKLLYEIYPEKHVKEIQKIGREIFYISFVASKIFKISTQAVRSKVKEWINLGIIKQSGTAVIDNANKPVHIYCVIEPIAVRLIYRQEPFDKFINNRWLVCGHCLKDNLMDISLYPEGNDATCINCGRNLI